MSIREFTRNCWTIVGFGIGLLSPAYSPAYQPPEEKTDEIQAVSDEQLPSPKSAAKFDSQHTFRFIEFLGDSAQVQSENGVFIIEIPLGAKPHGSLVHQAETALKEQSGSGEPHEVPEEFKVPEEFEATVTLSFDQLDESEKNANEKPGMPSKENPGIEVLFQQTWEPLNLRGEQTAHWLVRVEGNPTPLRIRVASRPEEKQFHIDVAIPSEDGKGTVRITPESASKVLKRLRQYERWLRSSSEEWKAAGASRDWRDGREAVARARLMAAKQKETERSLQKWSAIAELAEVVFKTARLEFTVK
jgi:hypothetical protein